jgi:4-hydroxy-4-methyl-2-oxoglutarate aldolase
MTTALPPVDELRRLLYTPVLSDVLDSFGLMRQALRPFVRPLDEALVLLGRVRTGRYAATNAAAAPGHNPYQLEMDLIDDLNPGEVLVLSCDGPTDWIAP